MKLVAVILINKTSLSISLTNKSFSPTAVLLLVDGWPNRHVFSRSVTIAIHLGLMKSTLNRLWWEHMQSLTTYHRTNSTRNGTKDLITRARWPRVGEAVLTHAHKAHVPRHMGEIRGRRSRKNGEIYERDRWWTVCVVVQPHAIPASETAQRQWGKNGLVLPVELIEDYWIV